MIQDRCSYGLCKVLLPLSSTGVVWLDFEGSIPICSCFFVQKTFLFLRNVKRDILLVTAAEYIC